MGAFVVGFKYLRRAGVGVSSSSGGMRSSVNGTRGSIEMIERVRKSSGVIIGAVRLEKDLAAERSAFRDAVRFDLNADLRTGSPRSIVFGCDVIPRLFCDRSNTRKSSSSISISGEDNGWSSAVNPDCEDIDCSLLDGMDLLPLGGVIIDPKVGEASLMESPSKDGIDSLESVLVDMTDSRPVSLSVISSSSSGGLNSRSNGLFPYDMLSVFSSMKPCWSIASTVRRCAEPLRYWL